MKSYKKREEEKKQRRDAIMAKYPPQNPRTNVSTVVTRKELPKAQTWEREQGIPAINRNVNAHLVAEPYPLKAGQSIKAEPYPLKTKPVINRPEHNREFAIKAATGWKSYQADEYNRSMLLRDPSYRKWAERRNVYDIDDALHKPARNWSFDENNHFGYLYGEDKKSAYEYARRVNQSKQKQEDIGNRLQDGVAEGLENLKEFGQSVWGNYTQAQERNSQAQNESAKEISEGWKRAGTWALDKAKTGIEAYAGVQSKQAEANRLAADETANAVKKAGQAAWNHHGENANTHSKHLVKKGAQDAESALQAGRTAFESAGDLESAQAESQKASGDTIYNTYTDFWKNPDRGNILGQATKVTGSDQTGASIYGFREDKRRKQPQNHWDKATFKEYQSLKSRNPKDAEQFAVSVNEAYHKSANEATKKKQVEQLQEQINDDYYASLHSIGARAAAPIKSVDSYNSMLEYAATGKMIGDSNLSLGEYSQAADDAIADRLETEHGKTASEAYKGWTTAFDGITTYAAGGPTADILRSAGETAFDFLQNAQARGESDKQAAEYAFLKSIGNVAIDVGVGELFKGFYIEEPERIAETAKNEVTHIVESSVGSALKNTIDYIECVEEYKKKGFSDKQAKHIASNEILKKGGINALDDVVLDAAQRRFADALKKSKQRK